MNQIIIENLKIFAYHGVHSFEKENGQIFLVSVILDFDDKKNFENDDISEVVSYSKIIASIKKTVTGKSYDLIEKVASRIISELFSSFDEIKIVDVTVKKPHAPINEDFEYVAVRIKKNREELDV